jgi:2-polyprenyl-6-methoxyphenol hydroxylase-like FAD-dependent oxidoreductase
MTTPLHVPVLIAGGGPTGLVLAARCCLGRKQH